MINYISNISLIHPWWSIPLSKWVGSPPKDLHGAGGRAAVINPIKLKVRVNGSTGRSGWDPYQDEGKMHGTSMSGDYLYHGFCYFWVQMHICDLICGCLVKMCFCWLITWWVFISDACVCICQAFSRWIYVCWLWNCSVQLTWIYPTIWMRKWSSAIMINWEWEILFWTKWGTQYNFETYT